MLVDWKQQLEQDIETMKSQSNIGGIRTVCNFYLVSTIASLYSRCLILFEMKLNVGWYSLVSAWSLL